MWRERHRLDWLVQAPIAHRGLHDASSGVLENTLPAFEAALERGYSVECDLQMSADGEAMVFHDFNLARLTGRTEDVAALPADVLTGIRCAPGGATIATLADLLSLVDGRVPLVIEVKSRWNADTRLVARAAACLARYGGPAALMSFDPVIVAWLADNAPAIPRGIVADGATHPDYDTLPLPARLSLRHMTHLPQSRPHFLSCDRLWLPNPASRSFRRHGRKVICWTVRSEQEASDALRWCDQVTFEGYLP